VTTGIRGDVCDDSHTFVGTRTCSRRAAYIFSTILPTFIYALAMRGTSISLASKLCVPVAMTSLPQAPHLQIKH
jgi:hypothetical protein